MPKERSLRQQDHLGNSWPSLVPPVIQEPVGGGGILSVIVGLPLALVSGSLQGGVADIASTDWQIRTGPNGTGSLVWSNTNANPLTLLSALVPGLTLPIGSTLYVRARQTSVSLGVGPWSVDAVFNT